MDVLWETHLIGGGMPPPYACVYVPFCTKQLSGNEPGDPQWRGSTARVADPPLTTAARRPSQTKIRDFRQLPQRGSQVGAAVRALLQKAENPGSG